MLPKAAPGQTRPLGHVGSMSGLPKSGHDWAIYEYTPELDAAGIAAAGDDAEVAAGLPECLLIDVGLSGRLLDDARLHGATSELLAQELLRALAAVRLCRRRCCA